MMPVQLHEAAREELREAAAYYENQQKGLGEEFLQAFRDAVNQIQNFPTAWANISAGSRRCRFNRFPYGLVYQIIGNEILILAVMHLHRHPTYWHPRRQHNRD